MILLSGTAVIAESGVRQPAVAGSFYPAEPAKLEAAVRAYLEEAVPPAAARPLVLVAPHAGYIFSGQIAADAYRQAMGHDYEVVVVLGTNHTVAEFRGVSVHTGPGYRTPLGMAETDQELVERLLAAEEAVTFSPAVHEREHSVEVHLPFIQVAFPKAKIFPAVIGTPDPDLCARFGRTLADVLKDKKALIVASSDLSHYPAYQDAIASDLTTLGAVTRLDPVALTRVLGRQMGTGTEGLATCACGEGPVRAAMEAAKQLEAITGSIVSYANSGDTAVGDRSRVVGYGALAFYDRAVDVAPGPRWLPHDGDPTTAPLSAAERQALLAFARSSIERYLATSTAPLARGFVPSLWRKQGVFVTLEKEGRLRGCIGHRHADRPLCQIVGGMALQAAFNDSRFPPVTAAEMTELEIEISLLSPLTQVKGARAVRLGRDGVLLRKAGREAVFLPQVATEQGWDRVQMMEALCRKAGLPPGDWRQGAELFTFQTESFSESKLGP